MGLWDGSQSFDSSSRGYLRVYRGSTGSPKMVFLLNWVQLILASSSLFMFVPPIFWQFWFDGILHARKIPLVDSKKKQTQTVERLIFFLDTRFCCRSTCKNVCKMVFLSRRSGWTNWLCKMWHLFCFGVRLIWSVLLHPVVEIFIKDKAVASVKNRCKLRFGIRIR